MANSYKHDNRCIAGVEVRSTDAGYELVTDDWNTPVWFRPINRYADAGAVPNDEALNIELFDVVRASHVSHVPTGAQQENWYYDSLTVVGTMTPTADLLKQLSTTHRKVLFGNNRTYIDHNYYYRLDYSVMMICPDKPHFYLKERVDKQPQPRMSFSFNGNEYDFPVTDPEFRHLMENDIGEANGGSKYFVTLSLGVECNGLHYKLVAGVVRMSFRKKTSIIPSSSSSNSAHISYDAFCRGKSIEQIANSRCLTVSTIASHLLPYVECGDIDIHQVVDDWTISRVRDLYNEHPNEEHLKIYYEELDKEVSYEDIRFVLAYLRR